MRIAALPHQLRRRPRLRASSPWSIALAGLGSVLVFGQALGCGHDSSPAVGPDGSAPGVCVGVKPPASAWSAEPSGSDGGGLDAGELDAGPPLGEPPPKWALRDFQPQSCGFQASYGLDVFRGEVTLLAVMESS
jgi:hypothetical protein